MTADDRCQRVEGGRRDDSYISDIDGEEHSRMRNVFFVVGQTKRSVAVPPPNPAAVLLIALARAVLTLVEFTQTA